MHLVLSFFMVHYLVNKCLTSLGGLLSVMTKAYSSYKSSKAGDKNAKYMLQEIVSKFDIHFKHL